MDNSIILWGILAVVLIAAAALAYKPLRARWDAQQADRQRHQVEDALRRIFDLQQEGWTVDQYRLAMELKINLQAVQALVARLQEQSLVEMDAARHLSLTSEGRRWAVQLIRAHRLWERYLADEVRMPLDQVHTAAHRHEHRISVAEVNALDAALGFPARDPHGDQIPSVSGELRDNLPDMGLVYLQAGQRARISHLEDEPPLAYAQLQAEGLYVGQSIVVQEVTPERVVVSTAEREIVLAPSIAENVCVYLESAREAAEEDAIPLGSLPPTARGEIVRIDERVQGFTRRRFLDLGLTPGTTIFPELENAFGDPRAYRVRGTLIALRKEQSGMIWVRPLEQPAPTTLMDGD